MKTDTEVRLHGVRALVDAFARKREMDSEENMLNGLSTQEMYASHQ